MVFKKGWKEELTKKELVPTEEVAVEDVVIEVQPIEATQNKEPRDMQVMMRGKKTDIRVIRKSEYDPLIHICI